MFSENVFPKSTSKPRKRPQLYKANLVKQKLLKVQSKQSREENCCNKLCFFQVPSEKREQIIMQMNRFKTKNEQSIYIASMVHLHTVAQRTTKGASRRSITFSYEVKLTSNETDEQNTISLDVCKNAFMQLLGITAQNLRTVQCSLKHNGMPPVDKRGKNPKKWKLSEKTVELVMKHISSYKGQLSHYSLKTSKRIYLPAALNKSKLYRDFNERYPLVKISQTSYTTILDSKFNISFGRNRKDTCSTCDAFKAEEVALEEKQCSTESKQKELDARRTNSI